MLERLERLLGLAAVSPLTLVYLLLAVGAAVENLLPPVPSDTFVLAGGILADRGVLEPGLVLAVAWTSNVAVALGVYTMARRYGRGIFGTRWGHWLLRPHQLQRLAGFYARYGLGAIFFSRFLPVFRVLVPTFAGITRLGFWRTALPLTLASGIWYGVVVYAGMLASRNLSRLLGLFDLVNNWLLALAALLVAGVALWWWRTRRSRREGSEAAGRDRAGPDLAQPDPTEARWADLGHARRAEKTGGSTDDARERRRSED